MTPLLHIPARSNCPHAGDAAAALDSSAAREITMVHLEPDDRLALDLAREHVVCVADGLLYLTIGDDDVMLMGGEQIVVPAGSGVHAWNAGDEPARVIVSDLS
jgi:hypothetical protein